MSAGQGRDRRLIRVGKGPNGRGFFWWPVVCRVIAVGVGLITVMRRVSWPGWASSLLLVQG